MFDFLYTFRSSLDTDPPQNQHCSSGGADEKLDVFLRFSRPADSHEVVEGLLLVVRFNRHLEVELGFRN